MSEAMKQIRIEKVTLNIGVGKPGPELDKAMKLLKKITGAKPVETKAKKRIPGFGIRPGLSIGCKVTIRGKKAEELLSKLLQAIDLKLDPRKIDNSGNFAFGIKEYLDIPNMEYDMDLGMLGLEVAVTLERPGFRVKKRRLKVKPIPKRHRITKEDTVQFLKERFNVNAGGQE